PVGTVIVQPQTQPGPEGAQGMPLAADSSVKQAFLCLRVDDNGVPVGVSDVFGYGIAKVTLCLQIQNAPPDTEIVLQWLLGGQLRSEQTLKAQGTGVSLMHLGAGDQPQLPEGAYQVKILENGRHVGTATFSIR
ncbi:MAG TPA: hypothetical protein VM283_10075, partial [Armatimonadota bacterium]|nr:hypothetical protein [Armatimonadota bacterium]